MAFRCEACGSPALTQTQRFCGECGAPLASAPFPVRERRLLSVLFCDVVGFSTMSESRDPEEVHDIMEQYFATARAAVESYGGTVGKFIGDAVFAVWGAPIAREDDAERSVRAGLDLTRGCAELAVQLAMPEFAARVGILRGEAAVDLSAVREQMIFGDAVNTAARIQALAPLGGVLVDDVTRTLTEGRFEYIDGGEHRVKGKSIPVHVWRAISARRASREPSSRLPVPPLVGRDREMARLRDLISGLTTNQVGTRLVALTGEAGIGKTRVLDELAAETSLHARVLWVSARVSAFGEGAGLGAIAELVREMGMINQALPPARQRERLREWFGELGMGARPDIDLPLTTAESLLGLGHRPLALESGVIFSGWRAMLERASEANPSVLVLDEIQNAAGDLLALMRNLVDWAGRGRILLIAAGQPAPWLDTLSGEDEVIELGPLDDEAIVALVRGVVREPPEPLLRVIEDEGGGNPLYAMETLRSLADSGVLRADGDTYTVQLPLTEPEAPLSLRGLIAARLDRLSRQERAVLAAAAVLGEEFTPIELEEVAGLAREAVGAAVSDLEQRSIFRSLPSNQTVGARYGFAQGAVRRVALSTLARRDRKRLHSRALSQLERSDPEHSNPRTSARLARHLLSVIDMDPRADDVGAMQARALDLLVESAERAERIGALEESLVLFGRALGLPVEGRRRAAILERCGELAKRAGHVEASVGHYRAAAEIHSAQGRPREAVGARAHAVSSEPFGSTSQFVNDMQRLSAELPEGQEDRVWALLAAWTATALYQDGQLTEAATLADRAATAAEMAGSAFERVLALTTRANALVDLDEVEEGLDAYLQAAESSPPGRQRSVILCNYGITLGGLGRFSEAVDAIREGITEARQAGDRAYERWSRVALGRPLCSSGKWDATVAELEPLRRGIEPFKAGMLAAPLVRIALGRAEHERVTELIAEFDAICDGTDIGVSETDFRCLRAGAQAILREDLPALATAIASAGEADLAEWSGWLPPLVDHLVASGDDGLLQSTLDGLRRPGRFHQTPPVQAQIERLEAHRALHSGDRVRAATHFDAAHALARSCGMVIETRTIQAERGRLLLLTDAN